MNVNLFSPEFLQVTIFRERVVLVAVYVETPKRRRFSPNNHRRRHHYRASNGTNRRADLLDYSRRLRESGRSESSNPLLLHPKPKSSPSNNQHPLKQVRTLCSPFVDSIKMKEKLYEMYICKSWSNHQQNTKICHHSSCKNFIQNFTKPGRVRWSNKLRAIWVILKLRLIYSRYVQW